MISEELERAYVIHSITHASIWCKYTYATKIVTDTTCIAKTFNDICLTLKSFNLGLYYQLQTSFNYDEPLTIDRIRDFLKEITQNI